MKFLRRLFQRKHKWTARIIIGRGFLIHCKRCGKERGLTLDWESYMANWIEDDSPCKRETP